MPARARVHAGRAGQLAAAEPDAAGVGPIEAADHVEHGGLAGAVGADQAVTRPGSAVSATSVAARTPPKAIVRPLDGEGLALAPAEELRRGRSRAASRSALIGAAELTRQRADHAIRRDPEHDQQQRAEHQQAILGEAGDQLRQHDGDDARRPRARASSRRRRR